MLRTGSSFSGRPCVQGREGTLQKAQAHRRQQRQRGAGDRCRPWRGQAGREEAVHSLAVDRRSEGGKVAAGLERGEARRSARSTTGDVFFNIAVWAFIHVITLDVIPRTGAWLREVASCPWDGKRIREPFKSRFSIEESLDVEGEIFHEILKKDPHDQPRFFFILARWDSVFQKKKRSRYFWRKEKWKAIWLLMKIVDDKVIWCSIWELRWFWNICFNNCDIH